MARPARMRRKSFDPEEHNVYNAKRHLKDTVLNYEGSRHYDPKQTGNNKDNRRNI